MILVSACLVGINCKYNGDNNKNKEVMEYLKGKDFIIACPEQLGGLSTPRIPCEIKDGDGFDVLNNKAIIINKNNEDMTKQFIDGAQETLKIAKLYNCKEAILKGNSPSCSNEYVYNGEFLGKKVFGKGVTCAMLILNDINVKNENEI